MAGWFFVGVYFRNGRYYGCFVGFFVFVGVGNVGCYCKCWSGSLMFVVIVVVWVYVIKYLIWYFIECCLDWVMGIGFLKELVCLYCLGRIEGD